MDEKQLLAVLIDTIERQAAKNAALLAALTAATEKIEGIVPAIQKTAGEVISVEAKVALTGAATGATEAAGTLEKAAQWFGWKVFALAIASTVGVCLVAWGSIWWPRHQIESLIEQKAALQIDVAELRENVAKLEKKGGRIKTNTCGGRFCIKIDDKGGRFGEKGEVWMIPDGY